MTRNDDDDIGAQVSSRLEEMFGEEDPEEEPRSQGAGQKKDGGDEENGQTGHPEPDTDFDTESSPLRNLKALVFGIDWEITDQSMKEFLEEVRNLQEKHQDDKILSTFLKLHESVGKYIRAKKARAHPDSIKFVTSVFQSFEKVLMTPDMPKSRKKQLLSEEIKKFKDFKEQVASRKKTEEPEPAAPEEPERKPYAEAGTGEKAGPVLENQEALDYIVAELRETIKAEFRTLRQIIKNLGA
ncbi:MAG: hypothetical protein KGY38_05055 [Desulfobacterales bacterium]|nr:hypothetical protein [Desulfobacterales bacterium]